VFDNLVKFVHKLVKIGKQEPGTPFSKLLDFLGFARRMFYPALFTLLYFIILVVAILF
jgi:hypothetical protein